VILDASALLAFLQKERGADRVSDAIIRGTAMSTVNLAEALTRGADRGEDPQTRLDGLLRIGLLGDAIRVEPFTLDDATETAGLRPLTRHAGLSLADRACLALALRLHLPVLTADAAWSRVDVGVDVRQIR